MLPANSLSLQNGTQYQLILANDRGDRLKVLTKVGAFSYTRVVNNYGMFNLDLPASFDRTLLDYDNRILIWRKPVGGASTIDFEGLIRYRGTATDEKGNMVRSIRGPSLEYLLDGRSVAYASGTSGAAMTDQADDMIKAIGRQNIGSSATAARQISSTYLSVANDDALGPSLTMAFSYRNCLDVIRDICAAARTAGTEVFFSIVPTGDATFELRTFIGQPGRDRTSATAGGPIFSEQYRNLIKPRLIEDAMEEANFVTGLGQGQGSNRRTQTAEDTARSGRSVFGRREGSVNANMETTDLGVQAAAYAKLVQLRPRTSFDATLISRTGSIYGKDWNFGDRVPILYDGRQILALVRSVTVKVDAKGKETLDPTVLEAYSLT